MNRPFTTLLLSDAKQPRYQLCVEEAEHLDIETFLLRSDDDIFDCWTSVIIVVDSDAANSLSETPAGEWNQEVATTLGGALRASQKAALLMQASRGRITLVWYEDDTGGTARNAIAGGCAAMVKAFSLDFAPSFIGFNGLALDLSRSPKEHDILACLDLLSSRASEGVIGQVLRPSSSFSASGWSSW